jgi:hypothetical protein
VGASRDRIFLQGISFQGSALERTAFEAPPRVGHAFATQEAGASGALRPQAEPGDECQTKKVGSWQKSAYCLLPTAYCLLTTAYCLLPTAY